MTVYITRCPVCQQAFKTNERVLALKGEIEKIREQAQNVE